jgi:quercetin dioxygenase-like cupin family protein
VHTHFYRITLFKSVVGVIHHVAGPVIGEFMSQKPGSIPVLKAQEAIVQEFNWGQLIWFVNSQIGNSEAMTFGKCILNPGCENPRHYHPNCEEILQIISGRVVHSLGDDYFEMGPGDTIVIPSNVVHNARNLDSQEAVMTIIFSSPDRQTQGEF